MSINEENAKQKIEDIGTNLPGALEEPDYYIEGSNLIITKGKDGIKVDTENLLQKIKDKLGNINETNDIIEIRGLKIDKTARRVWINGEEKAFTTKEFDLLTFLAENPNHVFTKEELFREIWDMESIGDIATVTVHIKKIREKIEVDTANPQYIETIWGVGYRFKV